MDKRSKIYIAGHTGMVGSAMMRCLKKNNYANLVTRSHAELDLLNQESVNRFFEETHPDIVIFAAAKVGGIYANKTYPAEFIYNNITITTNVIHAAYLSDVKRLIFLGSSCIYPKFSPQPMTEDVLLTDTLEPTNEAYAVAKIAGLKMCQYYKQQYGCAFTSVMPTNLYGVNDHYDEMNSHVLPALIHKIHTAKKAGNNSVSIWGTGQAKREFLLSDDLAEAILCLLESDQLGLQHDIINIGTGADVKIAELADIIASVVGYTGAFTFDSAQPDGTPRKLLDITKISELGWKPTVSLKEGIRIAYDDYCERYAMETV